MSDLKAPTFLHTFVSIIFWGVLTYCAFYYIPRQFYWQYSDDFFDTTLPMIKWILIFLPFIIWTIRSILQRKKNKELKKA